MTEDFYTEAKQPSNIDEWKDKSNTRLGDGGFPYKVVNSNWYTFLTIIFIVFMASLIFSIFYFLHLVNIGSFKSTTTQQVNLEPSINTTLYLNNTNNYQNYNNLYINNTIILPNNITISNLNIT